MCITQFNPSEPCCDDPLQRCVACPGIDWSANTFLWSHDSYETDTDENSELETRPAFEGKMTTLAACQWRLYFPDAPAGEEWWHIWQVVTLQRSRELYDIDGEWWRIYFGLPVVGGPPEGFDPGPYSFGRFKCSGEMTLTRSQERYDELAANSEIDAPFEWFPETIRLQRVSGQGPDLPPSV